MAACGNSIRELVRELVELQDRMDELRRLERHRPDPTGELHDELAHLVQREHEVIDALRRQRPD